MKGNDFLSVLPDGNGGAQFPVVTEVPFKRFNYLTVTVHPLKHPVATSGVRAEGYSPRSCKASPGPALKKTPETEGGSP